MLIAYVIAIFVIYLTIQWLVHRAKNYPPGPPSIPFLGNIVFIPSKNIHFTLAGKWRQKYGPLVGLTVGSSLRAVAVCGPREVLEILKREEFQGRPKGEFFKERSFNKYLGVFFSDGPFWLEQRRFTLRHLRDFGFGKKSMGDIIAEEVEDAIQEMSRNVTFQANGMFAISTLNVLWGMIAGTRYARDDAQLKPILQRLKKVFRSGNPSGGIIQAFPILKRIIPGLIGHTAQMQNLQEMQSMFRSSIKEHEKTIDRNNPRDLTDAYLREMNLQKLNPNTTFTEEGLITICLDLFIAGGETTTSSIEFSLMYMILYPEVQKAVQKELDAVVGQNRRPTLEDRPNLPYVEAVIHELLRVCSIAPIAPPHRATEDAYVNGYFIPKETMLIICIYSLMQDKEHWGDPENFRPERFLNSEGQFVKDEWMLPFGTGKRMCLGEVLARSTVYLFFTSLLQEFTFSLPEGEPKPSTIPLSGFTIAPQPFRVKVTKRN